MKIGSIGKLAILGLAFSSVASVAQTPTYKIVNRISVPDGPFDYAAFDAARGRVYMARGTFTTVINAKTGQASQLNASGGHMLLAIPKTNLGLIPRSQGTIRIIDIRDDKILADLPAGTDPDAAAYDPLSQLVFVVNKGSGETSVVNPVAKTVTASIPVGGVLQFPASDGVGHVFVNVDSVPEVSVIDVKSMKVTKRYPLTGCKGTSGLIYASSPNLLVSGCTDGTAKVLDAATGNEIASLPIGRGADATVYDVKRKLAFIPCGTDGVLEVISLADRTHISVVQTVQTQVGSRTATIDPSSGRIYLMASKPDTTTPTPANGRVPRLAGSFEVLVIGP